MSTGLQTDERTQPSVDENLPPRVFVIELLEKFDLTDCAKYGDVMVVFDGATNRPSVFSDAFRDSVCTFLDSNQYRPAVDFICLTGHLITVSRFVAVAINGFDPPDCGTYRALAFDFRTSSYSEISLP